MSEHPKIRLSRLRDIGWKHWDPIGLKAMDGGWQTSAGADEYDGYLLEVAGMVRRNEPDAEAINYLVWAESEHMGMGVGGTTLERAAATIKAIHDDPDLWSEPPL